jgi:hypothetical protein
MSDEATDPEVEVEIDDDETEEVDATSDEMFLSDGEFYTVDALKFFEVTGAIAVISVAGDIILMKPDGLFYKVEIAAKKFRPGSDKSQEKAGKVTSIKK